MKTIEDRLLFPAMAISKVLNPLLILLVILLLAGVEAELNLIEITCLLAGVAVLPGLVYKGSKPLLRTYKIPDYWRLITVTMLMLLATVACFLIPVPQPVPATVLGLFFGNIALAVSRKWFNVSAHVSVLTYGVLWGVYVYGTSAIILLILSPLMIFSRVKLDEHSLPEALLGAAMGLATFGVTLVVRIWS